jgi:hypothetical protein
MAFERGTARFCRACLDRSRQADLDEWDDLGTAG